MKLGFTVYDQNQNSDISELSLSDADNVIQAFANKYDVSSAKAKLKLPRHIIEGSYKDIIEVETCVIKAMNGNLMYDISDPDNIIYNIIPTTVEDLQSVVFNSIARDFAQDVQGSYTIEDVQELQGKVNLIINYIILYSKQLGDGDWEFFKNQF